MRPRVRVEEEVGRGEAVGAVWALTGGIHDTTALCVRDSELVRMSKVSSLGSVLQTLHARCSSGIRFNYLYGLGGETRLHSMRPA